MPLKCAVWSWNETAHPEDFTAVKRGAAQDKTALLEYFGTVERLLAGTDVFSPTHLLEYNALVSGRTPGKLMRLRHGLCLRKVDW